MNKPEYTSESMHLRPKSSMKSHFCVSPYVAFHSDNTYAVRSYAIASSHSTGNIHSICEHRSYLPTIERLHAFTEQKQLN